MGQRIPAEGAPAEAAPQGEQAGGEDQLSGLIQNLAKGLQIFAETVGGINPQLGQEAASLVQGFEGVVDKMSGGAQPPQGGQGMASPEAGASGAQPMPPGA